MQSRQFIANRGIALGQVFHDILGRIETLKCGLFLLACLAINTQSNGQMVLDSPAVFERYAVQNSGPFSAAIRFKHELEKDGASQDLLCELADALPQTDFFHEPKLLFYREWKTIALDDALNADLCVPRDSLYSSYGNSAEINVYELFGGLLEPGAERYLFKDHTFQGQIENTDSNYALLKEKKFAITHIRLKEDWQLDPKTGKIKGIVMGIAPCFFMDGEVQELCWMYYPEMRRWLRNKMVPNRLQLWMGLLNDHTYSSTTYKVIAGGLGLMQGYDKQLQPCYLKSDRFVVQNDLEYLVEIQKLVDFVTKVWEHPWEGKASITTYGGQEIEGEFKAGRMHGDWKWKNAKGIQIVQSFENNTASGKYLSTWPNGANYTSGRIVGGLAEGEWKNYYQDGQKMSVHSFSGGIMDGAQEFYYRNGNLMAEFSKKRGEIDGPITQWYANGKVHFKGVLKAGIVFGQWESHFYFSEELTAYIIKEKPNWPDLADIPTEAFGDGHLIHRIEYYHEFGEDWYQKLAIRNKYWNYF